MYFFILIISSDDNDIGVDALSVLPNSYAGYNPKMPLSAAGRANLKAGV